MKGMIGKLFGQISSLDAIGIRGTDARDWMLGPNTNEVGIDGREDQPLTQNEIVRRRRLAAFRWTGSICISYFLYKAVRRLLRSLTSTPPAFHHRSNYYDVGRMPNQFIGNGMSAGYGRYVGGGHGRHYQYPQGYGDY